MSYNWNNNPGSNPPNQAQANYYQQYPGMSAEQQQAYYQQQQQEWQNYAKNYQIWYQQYGEQVSFLI